MDDSVVIAVSTGEGGGIALGLLAALATAAVVALLAQRLRLSAVPAFLIAGALVGPHAIGLVGATEDLEAISQFATVLLLFGIGLELRIGPVTTEAAMLVIAGVGAVLGATALLWPVAALFGIGWVAAFVVAMAMSLSSTAVVLRLLSDRRELRRPHGRLALAILIVQDMAILGMLASLPLLQSVTGAEDAVDRTFLETLGGVSLRLAGAAGVVIVGKLALPRILNEAARSASGSGLMTILAVAIALGAGLTMQRLGFSAELGAFLAGYLLASTPFRHQLAGEIGPLRDLLIALFFTVVGMQLDPRLLVDHWPAVLLATLAVLALKSLTIGVVCWAAGAAGGAAVLAGLGLAQAGEFSLVLLSVAEGRQLVDERTVGVSVAVVILTLIATPPLMQAGRALAPRAASLPGPPWIRAGFEPRKDEEVPEGLVIIGGFGPVGRAVADMLDEVNVRYRIIELNPGTVQRQERLGRTIIYGDVSNPEILHTAGVEHAAALVLTIPDDDAALRAVAVARRLAPDLYIAVRTGFAGKGMLARQNGANDVVVEELTAAERMRDDVLSCLRDQRADPSAPEAAPDGQTS